MDPSPGDNRYENLGISVGVAVMGQISGPKWEGQAKGRETGGRAGKCFVLMGNWSRFCSLTASFEGLPPPGSWTGIIWSQSLVATCGREVLSVC